MQYFGHVFLQEFLQETFSIFSSANIPAGFSARISAGFDAGIFVQKFVHVILQEFL